MVDRNKEMQCLDKLVQPPDGQPDWYNGYGPGEVPGCRRAVCECDKKQVKSLDVSFM
jgi:hypothetical protein